MIYHKTFLFTCMTIASIALIYEFTRKNSNNPVAPPEVIVHMIPVKEYNIYIIDRCQYIGIPRSMNNQIEGLAHKGNCTNIIHNGNCN